jgi:hypothetical protein
MFLISEAASLFTPSIPKKRKQKENDKKIKRIEAAVRNAARSLHAIVKALASGHFFSGLLSGQRHMGGPRCDMVSTPSARGVTEFWACLRLVLSLVFFVFLVLGTISSRTTLIPSFFVFLPFHPPQPSQPSLLSSSLLSSPLTLSPPPLFPRTKPPLLYYRPPVHRRHRPPRGLVLQRPSKGLGARLRAVGGVFIPREEHTRPSFGGNPPWHFHPCLFHQ